MKPEIQEVWGPRMLKVLEGRMLGGTPESDGGTWHRELRPGPTHAGSSPHKLRSCHPPQGLSAFRSHICKVGVQAGCTPQGCWKKESVQSTLSNAR